MFSWWLYSQVLKSISDCYRPGRPPAGPIMVRYICNRWKNGIIFLPNRGSNPVRWTQSPTLYRVAVKAGLYRKAVQVCYIPIPGDIHFSRMLTGRNTKIEQAVHFVVSADDTFLDLPEQESQFPIKYQCCNRTLIDADAFTCCPARKRRNIVEHVIRSDDICCGNCKFDRIINFLFTSSFSQLIRVSRAYMVQNWPLAFCFIFFFFFFFFFLHFYII